MAEIINTMTNDEIKTKLNEQETMLKELDTKLGQIIAASGCVKPMVLEDTLKAVKDSIQEVKNKLSDIEGEEITFDNNQIGGICNCIISNVDQHIDQKTDDIIANVTAISSQIADLRNLVNSLNSENVSDFIIELCEHREEIYGSISEIHEIAVAIPEMNETIKSCKSMIEASSKRINGMFIASIIKAVAATLSLIAIIITGVLVGKHMKDNSIDAESVYD